MTTGCGINYRGGRLAVVLTVVVLRHERGYPGKTAWTRMHPP